jgi:formylglycine-generating enzyme required for sulfatase activity
MATSPFKLFEPYGPGDKDIFFGRDSEVFALYHLLQQTRLLLIYGASGTGKTSLINAGLPKAYKLTSWYCISVRRRDDINASFRQELARLLGREEPVTDLAAALQELYETRWIPIHLVFDQFEEVFTLGQDAERKAFFEDLQLLLSANLPCKILLSMREEYIGYLYDYEALVPNLFEKRFRVEPMKDSTVQSMIAQMCALYDIELEKPEPEVKSTDQSTTAQQILLQLKEGKQAVHLPYLQIYLHYLYQHAMETLQRPLFNAAGIAAVGQLGNVLRRFIVTRLEDTQHFLNEQEAPKDLAPRLLDEFATDEGTKCSRKRADLAVTLQVSEKLVGSALTYFCDTAKLLRADEDNIERYELVHDSIAKQIHELRTAEDKEFKTFVRELQLEFSRWEKEERNKDRLLLEFDLNKVEVYKNRIERREEYPQWAPFLEQSKQRIKNKKALRQYLNIGLYVLAFASIAFLVVLNMQAEDKIAKNRITIKKQKAEIIEQKTKSVESPGIVKAILANAEKQIQNLDYEKSWTTMVSAISFDTLQDTIGMAMLEPAIWHIETGKFTRARSMLDTISNLLNKGDLKRELLNLSKLDSAKQRQELRIYANKLDDRTYRQLMHRYYPHMLKVPGGKQFAMGKNVIVKQDSNALTQPVWVDNFELAKTETTVWQWAIFCATTGKDIKFYLVKDSLGKYQDQGNHPVVNVTWPETVEYANWLSNRYWLNENNPLETAITEQKGAGYQLKLNATGFRLPTEAEWEYAARAGGETFLFGNGKNMADPQEINFNASKETANSLKGKNRGMTVPVASLKNANALGLYDMSGNANEWVWDWFAPYTADFKANPSGPVQGKTRVFRGGSWFSPAGRATVFHRSSYVPNTRKDAIGFRVARTGN